MDTPCESPAKDRAAVAAQGELLALTSALRGALAGPDAGEVGMLARRLVALGRGAGLPPLARAVEVVAELSATAADAAALRRALGAVERVLDGCRVGADPAALARLYAVPAREIALEPDGAPSLPPPRARAMRPHADPGLVAAFAAEALDVLDRCEGVVLDGELESDGDALRRAAAELATVGDAAAAVGIEGADADPAGVDADALLQRLDGLRERIEMAWAAVDPHPLTAAAELPMDELFLRLRRVARDTACRRQSRLALATSGGEIRLTAGLAERIYEPLAQLIADAAAAIPTGSAASLRVHAERGDRQLSISIDPVGDEADGDASAEALHWIDARQAGTGAAVEQPHYRPGALNVVQVLLG